MTGKNLDAPDFASASLPEHLVRGAVGFGALIGSVGLIPIVGPVGLMLLPVALIALRGCPTCWAVGLMQTLSRGRLERSCDDGRCKLSVAGHDKHREPVASQSLGNGQSFGYSAPLRAPTAGCAGAGNWLKSP
ncbi:hypothetical protein [Nocardia jinanensis]|uniref:Uncharacterized protein n=1 Tax=Nocardia jinanensis TaxID=382504 RepID=A0A917VRA0_9NOCA|nr:hypothetical protein [Nocardia jinanensis]GGL06316.1 hypothetical protein GCM10011588_21020 [Nocardia jinanensis]